MLLPSPIPTRRALALLLARHKTTTPTTTSSSTARLALTHSTYIEGLVPVLRRLLEDPTIHSTIHTIVPGRCAVTRGKAPHFRLRVSAQTDKGGYFLKESVCLIGTSLMGGFMHVLSLYM